MSTVWITYCWADLEEGDFQYLVQALAKVGVRAVYDKIALVAGQRLWPQIQQKISRGTVDGWAYLLTPRSLTSEPCREELAYALDRALATKGGEFPLIGLVHNVRISDVPLSLKVRLCVSLGSATWAEEVKGGLEKKPFAAPEAAQTEFVWRVHRGYGGDANVNAVEVRPRFGEVMYWRFGVPAANPVLRWGHGPAGGGAISPMSTSVVEGGTGDKGGIPCVWFGAGDRLSSSVSAYALFNGPLPRIIGFGKATGPTAAPTSMEIVSI